VARSTFCEWKGSTYWDVYGADGSLISGAAWSFEDPSPGFEPIRGFIAFNRARFDCRVDGEQVRPQEDGFYAGWITSDVVGPFKGGPGTSGW
jgi:hypothetical protein